MSKMVPMNREAQLKAIELTRGIVRTADKYDAITKFIQRNIMYDYIRSFTIPKKNVYPDIDYCWKNRMGICQDIAALTVRMLRTVGVNAWLCIGHADGKYHAWVEAKLNGKVVRFDHPKTARQYYVERRYV